ncbi:ABC transporter substrate-binding protein [Kineothrix sp. MSJ-39]|uniref:ABC transporter substrate-binding protein n=1 Tax=Kineothrix sp. MSJ-39 TaxID=2841533 RepID=UPI001C11D4C4|nr:ABC transporter substrate-binding protein [Kineothrix sp. MSJ-39]MBU5430130.1 ABC transporter substrate-binding protein [Kineothrix sp. MSJ-39]
MKRKLMLAVCMAVSTCMILAGCGNNAADTETAAEDVIVEESNTQEETDTESMDTDSEESATDGVQVTPPSKLLKEGTLTYAINANFPPYEYLDDEQNITGFDVEYVQAMADLMGLDVEIVDMQWDNLITSLQAGRVDIVNSAVYINPEREKVVDFVPYMYIGEIILVNGNSDYDFTDTDGLSGLKVGVITGSIEETYCNTFNEEFAEKGMDPIDIHSLPSLNDSLVSLASGQLDATLTSSATAAYMEMEQPGTYKTVASFALDDVLGICVQKGDTEMADALTECAKILYDNGTYTELMSKYGISDTMSYWK